MVLNPRVSIDVQSNITLTAPGGPGIIALIGSAQWGPTSALQVIGSFSGLLDVYKDDKAGLSQGIVRSADIAYTNGAQTIKVIRVVDGTEAKSSIALAGNTGLEAGVLTFSGLFHGTYGDNILVTVTTQGSGRIVEVTDGVIAERYDNASNPNGFATNAAIAAAINGNSRLVSVAVKVGSETTNLVDAASNQALTGGADGSAGLDAADYTTAFDSFLANEDWDIIICPGNDALNASNTFQTTMLGKVNARASNDKKYGIFISGVTLNEDLAAVQARTAAGERLLLCAPSMTYTPRYQSASINLNGSFLAAALAGNISAADVEVSPTRKVLSVTPIVNTTSGKQFYTLSEIEQLLQQRVIPVSKIEGAVKVARGVTRIADTNSIFFEANIVRIVDFIKAQVQVKLDPFLGQGNLERVRNVMGTEVDSILQAARLEEVIANYLPTEVNVGASPDTVNVSMTIQPTFAINFINVVLAVSRL